MTNVGTIVVDLVANTSKFSSNIDGALGKLSSVASASRKFGAAISGVGVAGVAAFARFDNQIRSVRTLLDEDSFGPNIDVDTGFAGLRSDLLDFATTSTSSLTDLNTSLFGTVSAGAEAGKSIEFLNTVNRLAVAGVTDIASAQSGLSGIINAYGVSLDDAESVAAKFFASQKDGVTNVGELAVALGRVAPIAKSAGIPINELFAATAATTKALGSTNETVTGLKAAITNILKPSKDASEAAQALGVDFSAAGLRAAGGLNAFLEQIRSSEGFNDDTLNNLFGSTEALNAIFALDSQAKAFGDTLATLGDDTGLASTFQKAFDIQNSSPLNAFKRLRNTATVTLIGIGRQLEPIFDPLIKLADTALGVVRRIDISPIVSGLSRATGFATSIVDRFGGITVAIGAAAAFAAPLALAFGLAVPAIAAAAGGLATVAGILAGASGPIAAIGAGLGLLAIKSDSFRQSVFTLGGVLKNTVVAVFQLLAPIVTTVGSIGVRLFGLLGDTIGDVNNSILGLAGSSGLSFAAIQSNARTVGNVIAAAFEFSIGNAIRLLTNVKDVAGAVFTTIGDGLKAVFSGQDFNFAESFANALSDVEIPEFVTFGEALEDITDKQAEKAVAAFSGLDASVANTSNDLGAKIEAAIGGGADVATASNKLVASIERFTGANRPSRSSLIGSAGQVRTGNRIEDIREQARRRAAAAQNRLAGRGNVGNQGLGQGDVRSTLQRGRQATNRTAQQFRRAISVPLERVIKAQQRTKDAIKNNENAPTQETQDGIKECLDDLLASFRNVERCIAGEDNVTT